MKPLAALLALGLPGCSIDSALSGKDEAPFEGGDTAPDSGEDPPPEECNGVDDDGDGEVDEGFPDADGNGRVDCLDDTCPALSVAVGGAVDQAPDCDGAPVYDAVADPWRARLQWELSVTPVSGYPEVRYLPAVGDIDGDGLPEVAVVGARGLEGELVVIDGATGAPLWTAGPVDPYSGVAILDLDDDEVGEVVARRQYGGILAYEGDGTLKWESADGPTFHANTTEVAADVDGDGDVELIAEDLVLDGATGATELRLPTQAGTYFRQAAVADLDLDGVAELYFDGAGYDPDGTQRWRQATTDGVAAWVVPVQADLDPEGELVLLGNAWYLLDTDGSIVMSAPLSSSERSGAPCAADIDGDGKTEIALAVPDAFTLRDLDGSIVWSMPIDDSSGLAGCSATDLDSDGRYEILYGDQDHAWIFDGPTGAVRYEFVDRPSMTTFEYPLPADLDGDGTAELLLVQSGVEAHTIVSAWEHDGAGWRAYTDTWGVHDYSTGRQDHHAGIPSDSIDVWDDPGLLRATEVAPSHGSLDLVPTITDLCVADCTYGPVALAFTVENRGVEDAPAGVDAVVYADDGGSRREVARIPLPAVPGQTRLDGVQVDLTAADVGAYAMVVVVDEGGRDGAGAVEECDEGNNEDALLTGC